MERNPALALRAVVAGAIARQPSRKVGRIRFAVVGQTEERFLVELLAAGSAVREDDGRPADTTVWLSASDVQRLLQGWSLHGIRRAGDESLLAALATLLEPGKSALALRAHKDLGDGDGR